MARPPKPTIRRTLSLDAIVGPYLQGHWPKEAESAAVTCVNDKATQVSICKSWRCQSSRGNICVSGPNEWLLHLCQTRCQNPFSNKTCCFTLQTEGRLSCMLRISIAKISDVGSAGVWWSQFEAAGKRQPTGNSRFCSSSLNSAAPPSTVSAPN